MENNKKSNKKLFKDFVIFILFIVVMLWILLKDQDLNILIYTLKNVKLKYVVIGIFSMLIFFLFDAINIKRTLKYLGEKVSLWKSYTYSLIGFFFSSITPAATGGQPVQIYYMNKDKVNVAKSTATMTLSLISTQVITIMFGIIFCFVNKNNMSNWLILLFVIGVILNGSALIILIIAIWSRKLSTYLVNFFIKLLRILKVKNIDKKKNKIEEQLAIYHDVSQEIKNNYALILKTLLTTTIQYFFYYSIAYWVYKALGFNNSGIIKLIGMQALVYETASGIPLPGAVGVSEFAYIEIFKSIYKINIINTVSLLNRGINFYLFVIISGLVVVINEIRHKLILKNKHNKSEE